MDRILGTFEGMISRLHQCQKDIGYKAIHLRHRGLFIRKKNHMITKHKNTTVYTHMYLESIHELFIFIMKETTLKMENRS